MRRERDAARPPRSDPPVARPASPAFGGARPTPAVPGAARPYAPPAYPAAVPAADVLGPFASAALPAPRRPAGPPIQLAQEPPAPPTRRPLRQPAPAAAEATPRARTVPPRTPTTERTNASPLPVPPTWQGQVPAPRTQPSAPPAPSPLAPPTPGAPPAGERVLRRVDGSPIQPLRARPAARPKAPARPPQAAPAPAQTAPTVDLAAHEIILELPPRPAPAAPMPPPQRAPTRPHAALPAPSAPPLAEDLFDLPAEHLPPGTCPICHGAGYLRHEVPVGHPLFGRAVPCRCKEEEMEHRRRADLWRLSSLDAFQEMTFTTFNPKITGTREAWDVARRYAEDPDGWLVLSGPCGSGKTHLAAAIANHQFAQGNLVLFAIVPQLLDHLRAAFAPSSETTYDALFTKICEAGLLVLDDLGAEHTTPWAQEKLFQIINHRYMYGLSTVITTNLELINDLDDRVRSRLTDISLVRHVRLTAADFRPRHTPPRRKAGE